MTYRPKSQNFKSYFLSAISAAFAVTAIGISAAVSSFMILYQVSAVVFAVISLYIFTKYVQSDYVYKLCENELEIYKVTGNKSVCECSLSYEESLFEVVTGEAFIKNKKSYPKMQIVVNYCKTLSPTEYSCYFFNFNGKNAMLKFEPDKVFTENFNEKIKAAKSRAENEENDDE